MIIKQQPLLDSFDETRKKDMTRFKKEAKETIRLDILQAIEDTRDPNHKEYMKKLYKVENYD